MARPLRIEFAGAIYHVTTRGDRQEPIFVDDLDRRSLMTVMGQGMARYDAAVLAYCLMGNHYHVVVQTRESNLSTLMRHINGVYAQAFNRRHAQVGHLFQGRFHAILVDRDAYLLEVCRYVDLNPVRAGMVTSPIAWRWSSYRAHAGIDLPPAWLDTRGLQECMLGRELRGPTDHRRAADRYVAWVGEGRGVRLWDAGLRQQIYLGDEAFVQRMQAQAPPQRAASREIPAPQRSKPSSLSQWLATCHSREEALRRANAESGLSMSTLARQLGLSVSRVSRLIGKAERERMTTAVATTRHRSRQAKGKT